MKTKKTRSEKGRKQCHEKYGNSKRKTKGTRKEERGKIGWIENKKLKCCPMARKTKKKATAKKQKQKSRKNQKHKKGQKPDMEKNYKNRNSNKKEVTKNQCP